MHFSTIVWSFEEGKLDGNVTVSEIGMLDEVNLQKASQIEKLT